MSADKWFLVSSYPAGTLLAYTPNRAAAIAAAREWAGAVPGHVNRATVDGPDTPQGPGWLAFTRCQCCGCPDTVDPSGNCPDCVRVLATREPENPWFDI